MTKSIEEGKRTGNHNPVYIDQTNCMGRPNKGKKWWAEELTKYKSNTPLILNISGNSVEEFSRLVNYYEGIQKELAEQGTELNIIGYELNISCPNISRDEENASAAETIGSNPELVRQVVSSVKAATSKPIITKISPASDYVAVALAAESAGSDYIGCSNTWPTKPTHPEAGVVLTGGGGGKSGPSIKKDNMKIVSEVYQAINNKKTGIIAYGGAVNFWDIIDYAEQGAEITGFGTGFEYLDDKEIAQRTISDKENLEAFLDHYQIKFNDLVGAAHA